MWLFNELAVGRVQWCDIGVLRGRCVHVFCTPLRFNPLCMIGKNLRTLMGQTIEMTRHTFLFREWSWWGSFQPFPWFVWKTSEIEIDQHSDLAKHAGNTHGNTKNSCFLKGESHWWLERLSQKSHHNSEMLKAQAIEATNSVGFSKDLSISWRNHLWLLDFFHIFVRTLFGQKFGLSVSKIRCVRTWIKCTYLVRSPVHVQAVMFRVRIRKRSFWMFWRARFPP